MPNARGPSRTTCSPSSTRARHQRKELAATLALALPIEPGQWTVKVCDAPPGRVAESGPGTWAGVVPLRIVADGPVRAPWVDTDESPPGSVLKYLGAHG